MATDTDKAVQAQTAVADETKHAPLPKRRLPTTPQAFYDKISQREDIRAILSRLAKI